MRRDMARRRGTPTRYWRLVALAFWLALAALWGTGQADARATCEVRARDAAAAALNAGVRQAPHPRAFAHLAAAFVADEVQSVCTSRFVGLWWADETVAIYAGRLADGRLVAGQ